MIEDVLLHRGECKFSPGSEVSPSRRQAHSETVVRNTPENRARFARENQEGRGSWRGEYVGRFAR